MVPKGKSLSFLIKHPFDISYNVTTKKAQHNYDDFIYEFLYDISRSFLERIRKKHNITTMILFMSFYMI